MSLPLLCCEDWFQIHYSIKRRRNYFLGCHPSSWVESWKLHREYVSFRIPFLVFCCEIDYMVIHLYRTNFKAVTMFALFFCVKLVLYFHSKLMQDILITWSLRRSVWWSYLTLAGFLKKLQVNPKVCYLFMQVKCTRTHTQTTHKSPTMF